MQSTRSPAVGRALSGTRALPNGELTGRKSIFSEAVLGAGAAVEYRLACMRETTLGSRLCVLLRGCTSRKSPELRSPRVQLTRAEFLF